MISYLKSFFKEMNEKQKIYFSIGIMSITLILFSVELGWWPYKLINTGPITFHYHYSYFIHISDEVNWLGIIGLSLLSLSITGFFLFKDK